MALTYQQLIDDLSLSNFSLSNLSNFKNNVLGNVTNAINSTQESPYKFTDWAKTKGYDYNYDTLTNTGTINGVALPNNITNLLKSEYATEATYKDIITQYQNLVKSQQETQTPVATGEEEGVYKSPYQQQIEDLYTQLEQYTPYKTPEELQQYIFQLLQSANQPFTYDSSKDEGLRAAQEEAQRTIREAQGARGVLYSSGTLSNITKAMGSLIPEYETKAYQRYSDQKNREISMVSTLMKWDELQADRYQDQLELIKTKFDYIMQLDQQNFQAFQIMLEQRNFQKEYDLQMQQLQLDRKISEIEQAYQRVDALGYVDNKTSIILGLPVGEKAGWVKQAELQHKQELEKLKKEQANQIKLQKEQAKIEKSLIGYKNSLETASQKKLMAEQYAYDKKLAEYQHSLEMGGNIKGTAGIISSAKALMGTKYVWGGTSPTKGMDCSGFAQYVMKQNGINIPRVSADQAKAGTYVSKSNLQPGDLIFFDTIAGNGRSVDHVGIYIGNGQMIHASSGNGKVIQVSMNTNYWNQRYTTARRFVSSSSSSGSKTSGGSSTKTIGKNITSTSTKTIQQYLSNWGASLVIDGAYGPNTTDAVKAFQRTKGLKADGIVGPATLKELKKYTKSTVKKPIYAG